MFSPLRFPCGAQLLSRTLAQERSLPNVLCAMRGLLCQQLLIPGDVYNRKWGNNNT